MQTPFIPLDTEHQKILLRIVRSIVPYCQTPTHETFDCLEGKITISFNRSLEVVVLTTPIYPYRSIGISTANRSHETLPVGNSLKTRSNSCEIADHTFHYFRAAQELCMSAPVQDMTITTRKPGFNRSFMEVWCIAALFYSACDQN